MYYEIPHVKRDFSSSFCLFHMTNHMSEVKLPLSYNKWYNTYEDLHSQPEQLDPGCSDPDARKSGSSFDPAGVTLMSMFLHFPLQLTK